MERLTRCVGYQNGNPIYKTNIDMRCIGSVDKLKNALGKYEDLEEQGRLVKLPCKVGDTLYSALGEKVLKSEVISVKYHCEAENHGVFIRERIIIDTDDFETEINFSDIGKTVFFTQAEAEARLKELRGKNE